MNAEPLKKSIHDKAKELGIENIVLQFSGGSDEGFLDIELIPYEKHNQEFANEIEDWAWEVYSYSGAGEGNDYGDNIDYNLKTGKVSTNEWFTSRQVTDYEHDKLQISEDEES
jgi:hypothetical protein